MKIENSVLTNAYQNTVRAIDRATESKTDEYSQKDRKLKEDQLIKAIENSNEGFEMESTSLKFSIHEKTKQIMVKVIDDHTKEVLREIPPEKILDMVAAMIEKTGLFVDKHI